MTEELSPPETVKTNPTVLPDGFIRTLSPIIQIRHPAISIPSYYRAILHVTGDDDLFTDDFLYNRTYVFSRMIFDWYCDNVFPERKKTQRGHDSYPLVVDGIDLVDDNERVISAICELTGLDKQGVSTGWDPVSDEARKKQLPHQERFLSTLQSSSGVMKSGFKNGEISIETEAEKWVEEFGSKAANRLKEVAEATMDDYMYLRQYRV